MNRNLSEIGNMEQLISAIKEDCKYWEQLNDKHFYQYMYLQECKNSKETGLYQLILNGVELWYGTLAEINAVVKSMIICEEKNNFLEEL